MRKKQKQEQKPSKKDDGYSFMDTDEVLQDEVEVAPSVEMYEVVRVKDDFVEHTTESLIKAAKLAGRSYRSVVIQIETGQKSCGTKYVRPLAK